MENKKLTLDYFNKLFDQLALEDQKLFLINKHQVMVNGLWRFKYKYARKYGYNTEYYIIAVDENDAIKKLSMNTEFIETYLFEICGCMNICDTDEYKTELKRGIEYAEEMLNKSVDQVYDYILNIEESKRKEECYKKYGIPNEKSIFEFIYICIREPYDVLIV